MIIWCIMYSEGREPLLTFFSFSFFNYHLVGAGNDSSKGQDKVASGPLGFSSLPVMPRKSGGAQVKSITSGSSGEQSDDEGDGETETTQNMDPVDAKRIRRY